MVIRKSFAALGLVIGLMTGCGGDNFNGSYIAKPRLAGVPAMDVDGDRALFVLVDKRTSEFSEILEFDVSYKDNKMFLDVEGGGPRLVYARGVDERGLECLNCKDYPRTIMPNKFMPSSKALGLEGGLREQQEEERAKEEEKNRAFLKRQEENAKAEAEAEAKSKVKAEAAQARIEEETKKLGPFEGVWVVVKQPKTHSDLRTFIIDSDSGVTQRFYHTWNEESDHKMLFEVTGGDFVWVIPTAENQRYKLNAEGNELRCISCAREEVWLKLDPSKANDRSHLEKLANRLQKAG